MICPHCTANLKRKDRPGSRCGTCKKPFVFEPKENPLALHDVKVRRLTAKLGEDNHWYTTTQLWYAAARKSNKASNDGTAGCGIVVPIIGGVVLIGVGLGGDVPALAAVGGVLLLICVSIVVLRMAGVTKRAVVVKMPLDQFRKEIIGGWSRVYGNPPGGIIDEPHVRPGPPPPQPAFAILSPDPSVLACLRVNDVGRWFNAALAAKVADLPPAVPVAVIHDASLDGELFLATARHELRGRRVIDLGLRPRTVLAAKDPFKLRTKDRQPERIAWLKANTDLTPKELEWLGNGWSSPVAALRPAQLLARVKKVSDHLRRAAAPDPAERAAKAVGFMTWPAA
ncbi:hypothetical protein OHA72_32280 [Dactylosporangium sp. NBC_01737]|uniref:hypothetical protein n=1 Tax=Dactylosporangium sp. NBC_01737 TaxID=2975959 RepID=UPI002E104CFB|nr:hypothetical protein OHA72_32280 [Dactylosporangium sp. NBC_01737]